MKGKAYDEEIAWKEKYNSASDELSQIIDSCHNEETVHPLTQIENKLNMKQ